MDEHKTLTSARVFDQFPFCKSGLYWDCIVLTVLLKCITRTQTLKTPNQASGCLCRNTTEFFIISTACTLSFLHVLYAPVEYTNAGKTQQAYFVFFFGLLQCPPFSLSPSPSLFISPLPCNSPLCFSLEVEPIALASLLHHWKSSSTCDAERAEKAQGIWHVSSNVGSERRGGRILYAGRISLIEVSAWENCRCMRVNVWV